MSYEIGYMLLAILCALPPFHVIDFALLRWVRREAEGRVTIVEHVAGRCRSVAERLLNDNWMCFLDMAAALVLAVVLLVECVTTASVLLYDLMGVIGLYASPLGRFDSAWSELFVRIQLDHGYVYVMLLSLAVMTAFRVIWLWVIGPLSEMMLNRISAGKSQWSRRSSAIRSTARRFADELLEALPRMGTEVERGLIAEVMETSLPILIERRELLRADIRQIEKDAQRRSGTRDGNTDQTQQRDNDVLRTLSTLRVDLRTTESRIDQITTALDELEADARLLHYVDNGDTGTLRRKLEDLVSDARQFQIRESDVDVDAAGRLAVTGKPGGNVVQMRKREHEGE